MMFSRLRSPQKEIVRNVCHRQATHARNQLEASPEAHRPCWDNSSVHSCRTYPPFLLEFLVGYNGLMGYVNNRASRTAGVNAVRVWPASVFSPLPAFAVPN